MQPARPGSGLASEVFLTVTRLARDLQARQPVGLTASEVGVLTLLEAGPATPARLAAAERVKAPSMSRHLAALKARGLASQAADPADGRQVVLALTDEGRAVLAAARDGHWLARNIDALDAGQQDKLREALPVLGELHMIHDAKSPQ
jgi:DNA-binding MarR family transcriptional regulator